MDLGGKAQKSTTRRRRAKQTDEPMNCHPAVDGEIVVSSSCYTPNILRQIRDAYNASHKQETPIAEDEPTALWHALKARFSQCPKEDCWLKELKDDQLRKRIQRYVFAPKKPPEWKKNKNAWLSNFDILNVLEQYEMAHPEFEFLGPSPIDFDAKPDDPAVCVCQELCDFNLASYLDKPKGKQKTKFGIVFNLDPHTKGGSHWVSVFVDTDHRLIFYLDSAGDSIPKDIQRFVDQVQATRPDKDAGAQYEFLQNAPKVHQKGTTECGMYALFFIITMLTGTVKERSPKDGRVVATKELSLAGRKNMFLHETIPDKYMERYRSVYFND